ncbi:unnamed protein product [Amoebophrya sp. A120]|nr:unnamed protein product [Amoebophrya sp. A120]|eukprot:GSA120T00021669001.1
MLAEEDFKHGTLADVHGQARSPTRRNAFLAQENAVYKEEVMFTWNVYRRLNDCVQHRRDFTLHGCLQLIQNIFKTVRHGCTPGQRERLGVLFGVAVYHPVERQVRAMEEFLTVSYVGIQDVINLFYDPVSEEEWLMRPPEEEPRHDIYYSPRGKPPWNFREKLDDMGQSLRNLPSVPEPAAGSPRGRRPDMEEVKVRTEERKKLLLKCMEEVKAAEQQRLDLPKANGLSLKELVAGGLLEEEFARKVCADIQNVGLESGKTPAYLQPRTSPHRGGAGSTTSTAAAEAQNSNPFASFSYDTTEITIGDFLKRLTKPAYRKLLADEFEFLLHKKRIATESKDARLEVGMNEQVEKELGLRRDGRVFPQSDEDLDLLEPESRGAAAAERAADQVSEEIVSEVVTTDEERGKGRETGRKADAGVTREADVDVQPVLAGEAAQLEKSVEAEKIEVLLAAKQDLVAESASPAREVEDILGLVGVGAQPQASPEQHAMDDILAGLEGALGEDGVSDLDGVVSVQSLGGSGAAAVDVMEELPSSDHPEQVDLAFESSFNVVAQGLEEFLEKQDPVDYSSKSLTATFESELPASEVLEKDQSSFTVAAAAGGDSASSWHAGDPGAASANAQNSNRGGPEADLFGLQESGEENSEAMEQEAATFSSKQKNDTHISAEEEKYSEEAFEDEDEQPAEGDDAEVDPVLAPSASTSSRRRATAAGAVEQEAEDEERDAESSEVVDLCEAASIDRSLVSTLNRSVIEELDGAAHEVDTDAGAGGQNTTTSSSFAKGSTTRSSKPMRPAVSPVAEHARSRSASPTTGKDESENKPQFLRKPWLPSGTPATGAALLMSLKMEPDQHHEPGNNKASVDGAEDDGEVAEKQRKEQQKQIQTQILKKKAHVQWLEQKMSSTQVMYEQELEQLAQLKIERSRRQLPMSKTTSGHYASTPRTRSLPPFLLNKLGTPTTSAKKPVDSVIPSHKLIPGALMAVSAGIHHTQHAAALAEQADHQRVHLDTASTSHPTTAGSGGGDHGSSSQHRANKHKRGHLFQKDPFTDFLNAQNKKSRISERVFRSPEIMADWMHGAREEARLTYRLTRLKTSDELFHDHLFFSPTGQRVMKERQLIMGEKTPPTLRKELKTLRKLRKLVKRSGWQICHDENVIGAGELGEKRLEEVKQSQFFKSFTARDDLLTDKMLEEAELVRDEDEKDQAEQQIDAKRLAKLKKGAAHKARAMRFLQQGSMFMGAVKHAKREEIQI